MSDSIDATASLSSDPFHLAFCFCLFGFFGSIISASVFLHWSQKKTNNINNDINNENINDASDSQMVRYSNSNNNINNNNSNHQHHLYQYCVQQNPQWQMNRQHQQQQQQQYQQQQQQQQAEFITKPGYFKYNNHYFNNKFVYTSPSSSNSNLNLNSNSMLSLNCNNNNNNNNNNNSTISPVIGSIYGNSTQIILDWDDTLFPTAYTLLNMKNGINCSSLISNHEWLKLNELMNTVLYILLMFIQLFGSENVTIITNARRDWFNESCKIYKDLYKEVRNILVNKYKIKIISAHDSYKRQKTSAFMHLLQTKYNINQVICIGDSMEEYDAIHNVCNTLRFKTKRQIYYYRFKLLQSPSLNAMIRQLESIKNLDFNLISKQKFDSSYQFQ